jgi:multiple sugar transport system permease protein
VWLVFPLVSALQMSLHDWGIVPGSTSPFVGLDHYAQLVSDPLLRSTLANTVGYVIVTVAGQLALGLAVALGLESVRRGRVVLRTLYFVPVVTSWVVAALMFRYLFNSSSAGMVNHLLVDVLGIVGQPVPWLNEADSAFIAIFALGTWKGVGFAMILFIAALQAIPDELYDAAAIDGASRRRAIRSVTLPLLAPTIVMTAVMLTIGAFQVFIPVALITGGGPLHRTEVILTYLYDVAFRQLDFGYAGAISFALAALVFAISQIQLRFMKQSALAG